MNFAPLMEIEALGMAVGHADDALTRLGLRACEMASQGLIGVDQARMVYDAWRRGCAKGGRAGERGEPAENRDVETTNLAGLIRLGAKRGLAGVQVLRRMIALYDCGVPMRADELESERGRYASLIETARRQLEKGAGMLTDDELKSIFAS